jgi:hypothetical protein
MSSFVSPTGYVDLDNDCQYNLDRKSQRSREEVNPKEDLAFYFDTYIVPKYALNNINVNNVASFMKDLEMNWSKLSPELQSKVMDIMVDGILSKNTSFKTDLLAKLGVQQNMVIQEKSNKSNFKSNKSNFGMDSNKVLIQITLAVLILAILFVVINRTIKF